MADRTGLGLVERLVLETIADIDASPNRPYRKCARIAGTVRTVHGVHADQAYATLCALAADWLQAVPLVDGHGNLGSTDPHFGLTKDGPGTQVLSGTNAYTRATTVSGGSSGARAGRSHLSGWR